MENEKMNVQETMEQQNEQPQKAVVADGKIPTAQLPTKFMLVVRIAAGAYVAYAGFSAKAGLATMAGAEKAFSFFDLGAWINGQNSFLHHIYLIQSYRLLC